MLLLSAPRAALALGTTCASPTGAGEEGFLEQLRMITSRVEGMLNVGSLTRAVYKDFFRPAPCAEHSYFRLTNGFVSGTPTVAGLETPTGERFDPRLGTIGYSTYVLTDDDYITIEYESGFEIPEAGVGIHEDANYRVAIGVPEWMENAVVDFLVEWRRTRLIAPQVTKEYGFLPTLNDAIWRGLRASVYEHYLRPRADAWWPFTHAPVPPPGP